MFNSRLQLSSRSLVILGSGILGAIAAFGFLATMFDRLPNEMARSESLLKALHGATTPLPQIVVMGNSIAMNGVDARRLSREIMNHPVAWNLSSTDQTLIESMLLADELPDSVDTVVLTVSTSKLVMDASDLSQAKLLAYLRYGYQPSEATRQVLLNVGSPSVVKTLEKPKWKLTLDSRQAVRSAFDISFRSLLRKDLNLAKAQTDLFFPSPFTKQLPPDAIEAAIDRIYQRRTDEQGHLTPSTVALLEALSRQLHAHNIRLAIVVLPEHPALQSRTERGFYRQLIDELNQVGQRIDAPVVSFVSLLDANQFVDHIHPNAQGAEVLTDTLAQRLLTQKLLDRAVSDN